MSGLSLKKKKDAETETAAKESPKGKGKKGPFDGLAKKQRTRSFAAQARGKLCFAFDFGEYAVKIAVGKIGKDRIDVKHLILLENDERKTKLTAASLVEWRKKINRAFSQRNLSPTGNLGLVTIGCRNYISRQMNIPYAGEEDRQGLVAYEMSSALSLDMEAYLFQHKVLDTYEESGVKMCAVWAAAVPKELCELYYSLLESLRLKPAVMDIDVNGVERLMAADSQLKRAADVGTVAVIDLGIRGTEVSIYEKGLYKTGANVEQGDGRLVTAAKNALGVQIADIHNGNKLVVPPKTVYEILLQADRSENARMFRETVEEWLSAVNMVIRQYDLNHQDAPVSRLMLYGGSPQVSWLKAYLEKYLEIPAEDIQSADCFHMIGRAGKTEHAATQYLNALDLLLIK